MLSMRLGRHFPPYSGSSKIMATLIIAALREGERAREADSFR